MKKKRKFLSLLLSVYLVTALLPAAALADSSEYGLWVNGIAVNADNASNILGDGTASYEAASQTLTLNGAQLTSAYNGGIFPAAIYADENINNLKIVSTGKNSIDAASTCGIFTFNSIEFSGSGSLSVSAQDANEAYAVYSILSGITITSGQYIFSSYGTITGYGIMPGYGAKVTVNGGSLTAIGDGGIGVAIHTAGMALDFSNYSDCTAVASLNANGEPELEYSANDATYYKYIKVETPAPLEYDENGFTADKKHYEPASLNNGWYEIKNAGNLFWFAQFLKEDDTNQTANARLTADITIPEGMNWLPMEVGYYGIPYNGTFDGNYKTITGLKIRYGSQDFYAGTGLFESLGTDAVVKNLGLIGTDIQVDVSTIGSICGTNYGIIENCFNTGDISGTVYYSQWVGGIAGRNYGTIRLCYNTGDISAQSAIAGGICGDSQTGSEIENCYNTGVVSAQWSTGGICGELTDGASIANCYNTGTVTFAPGYSAYSHGIAAYGNLPVPAQRDTITNSYYLAESESADGGKTQAQFASGEIAYLLNGSTSQGELVWGQTVGGNEAQSAPVFNGETVYAGYEFCYSETLSYGNDQSVLFETKPEHNITGEWLSDENGHWQACQNEGCSQTGVKEAHSPASELINVSEPTASSEGYTGDTICSVCKRILAYGETIDKLAPSITQGGQSEYTPGESQPLSIQSDASIEDFIGLNLNGQEIDTGSYTVTETPSGVMITLAPEYLDTLEAGKYTLEMVFNTGTAKTELTINNQPEPNTPGSDINDPDTPQSGDSSSLLLWLGLFLLFACTAGTAIYRYKRQS